MGSHTQGHLYYSVLRTLVGDSGRVHTEIDYVYIHTSLVTEAKLCVA